MDASQYKDYVLAMLFIKYVSDKDGSKSLNIPVPKGANFAAMCKLKGKDSIGDDINKKIIAPLRKAFGLMAPPDFNDPEKLGRGKEMVDRLTRLIGIFERKELDFRKNKAEGDDLLGDAYEYLMRHFATESGKSKGQFYTPSEVSRVMARILEINRAKTSPDTSVYDPTCGSGSLLLKVADQAPTGISLFGQEKDASTTGLSKMNMILHACDTADIRHGNALSDPLFRDKTGRIETFDYVVANPPFISDKNWGTGFDPDQDEHARFAGFGVPPAKNGDYAYLLHIVSSLKATGRGACILPHGVLFRGNAEAVIRRNLIEKRLIKGIIGLPANLFYGTGIPACIVMVDKVGTDRREGIMMIDASRGYMKNGNKNRLRERDIHRILDAFTRSLETKVYSRLVPWKEIEENDFNLNIPRYIDSGDGETSEDIEAHLKGDIPSAEVDSLAEYWAVMPGLKEKLFATAKRSKRYYTLKVDKEDIRKTITEHEEFETFAEKAHRAFEIWTASVMPELEALGKDSNPKEVIGRISEGLLERFRTLPLMNPYEVYQHLMTYWAGVMQDDAYIIAADGWSAATCRITVINKSGKSVDKGWTCDLLPKEYIIRRFFPEKDEELRNLENRLEELQSRRTETDEEQSGEEGVFAGFEKINRAAVSAALKKLADSPDTKEEQEVLEGYLELLEEEAKLKAEIKTARGGLDASAYKTYPKLNKAEVKDLVINDKWMTALREKVEESLEQVSQYLSSRLAGLAEQYARPLPKLEREVETLSAKVDEHLKRMGFAW